MTTVRLADHLSVPLESVTQKLAREGRDASFYVEDK
jgi:hypothetical protein